ncbi:MAG: acetyl-CoA carboxylase biotin carboxyl carrier protein [Puniceicoccaceae bacterium]|nr:MAG: acetyl-CoA carboxylase biotin carboxyl carrier protein [Puniceicoccaceae bacterium]
MDLKEIKQIIDLMKRSDLTEFSVEEQGFKLRIRRGPAGAPVAVSSPAPALPPPAAPSEPAPSATPSEEIGVDYITSPMVGTFYRAPGPETPPFCDVNQLVEENSIVCIIEAMKIMNEIPADKRGTILEILVENGQPVEFGQRLFKIKAG